jgi:glutamyl-tRNA reductase
VNKILHPPSETLREAGIDPTSHSLIEVIRKLFGIKR